MVRENSGLVASIAIILCICAVVYGLSAALVAAVSAATMSGMVAVALASHAKVSRIWLWGVLIVLLLAVLWRPPVPCEWDAPNTCTVSY